MTVKITDKLLQNNVLAERVDSFLDRLLITRKLWILLYSQYRQNSINPTSKYATGTRAFDVILSHIFR